MRGREPELSLPDDGAALSATGISGAGLLLCGTKTSRFLTPDVSTATDAVGNPTVQRQQPSPSPWSRHRAEIRFKTIILGYFMSILRDFELCSRLLTTSLHVHRW